MIIGKRHDTRQYRLLNSYFGAFVDKPKIGVRIIEILGYRAVGASFKLFPKPINVFAVALCLWMNLWIGSDLNFEMVSSMLSD